jgi:hypothetical protein
MAHLTALGITALILGGFAIACAGWGRGLRAATGMARAPADEVGLGVWLGWAVGLGLFQFVHLFLPLRGWVVGLLVLGGWALFFRLRPAKRETLPVGNPTVAWMALLAWTLAVLWMCSRAMKTPLEFDGALYHFQAVKWINEERIMPGLGNLHGRLAFNSAFYPFVAALNFEPWFGHGRSLANTFLGALLLGQIFWRLSRAGSGRRLGRIADVMAVPPILYLAVSTLGLASPSVEIASSFLQIAIFLLLVRGVEAWRNGEQDQTTRAAALVVLAVTAVTLKLSNAGFAAGVLIVVGIYVWRSKVGRPILRVVSVCSFALTAIFVVRGYVMSGYPAYPSTWGGVDFHWAVAEEQARRDADQIYSWARQPWAEARDVLGNHRWMGPWFERARRNIEVIVAPVGFAFLAGLVAAVLVALRRRKGQGLGWVPVVPLATGLIFWWFTAPDPRFANATFWLLPVAGLVGLVAVIGDRFSLRPGVVVWCLVVTVSNLHFARWVGQNSGRLFEVATTGWEPLLPPGFTPRVTDGGLVVNTYRYHPSELIWDGPRPATPDFNSRLRLRVPDRPEFGFTVK